MPLTILSDKDVRSVLDDLTKEDVEKLQTSMSNALHEYSVGTTNSGAAAENQPKRTIIESITGSTTLFMPSTSSSGIGIKVVTLAGAPSITPEASNEDENESTSAQGALTIMSRFGQPTGFLNAEEITAFRTALASSLLITRRRKVKTIVVFGAGKQAYWHVRLALLLRGPTIKRVHFIIRDFNKRATNTMKSFISCSAERKRKEGWYDTSFDLTSLRYFEIGRILKERVRKADVILCTTPSTEPLFEHAILTSTEGRMRPRLIVAVGSYKPHMIEVPSEVLAQAVKVHGSGHHFHKRAEEGGVIVVDTIACVREAGELVQAGIKATQTVELGELVMLEHMDIHEDEAVIDDSPRESSEIVSPLSPQDPTRSLAKVFRETGLDTPSASGSRSNSRAPSRKSSRGSFNFKRSASISSLGRRKNQQTEQEDQMSRWLSGGNVIYKSVGMGLMDLVVGAEIIRLAREKGVGSTVDNF